METLRVLRGAFLAQEQGEPAAMATVVGIAGSGYRHEGARLLIRPDGGTCGALSGGCLEADVVEIARQVIAEGRPRRVTYDLTHDEEDLWGLGTGCNVVVEILIEPLAGAPGAASPPPPGA